MLSFYKTVESKTPTFLSKSEVYDLFRSDAYKSATEAIQRRFHADIKQDFPNGKSAYQKAKKDLLPGVCFAGNVDRSAKGQQDFKHSGLLTLDVDENDRDTLEGLFHKIQEGRLVYVEAAARSVSGSVTGALWVNVRIEIPLSQKRLPKRLSTLLGLSGGEQRMEVLERLQNAYWTAFKHLFSLEGIDIGTAGKDLKRVRYVAHDSGLYLNERAERFSFEQLEAVLDSLEKSNTDAEVQAYDSLDIEFTSDAFEYAQRFAHAKGLTYADGQKHNFRNAVAIALNLLGVPKDQAEGFILSSFAPSSGTLSNEVSFPYSRYKDSFGRWSGRLKADDLAPEAVIRLRAGQRVSDYADQVTDFILKHEKTDLAAGTGTGKNFAVVHRIAPILRERTGAKTVIVCSLNAKAAKDAEQYNVPYLTGQRLKEAGQAAPDVIREALKAEVILVNQNYFPTLMERLERRMEQVHCFVDEAHTLTAGYRSSVIRKLWEAAKRCKTVTLLSGTPKPYFGLLGYKRLTFVQESRPAIYADVREYEGSEVDQVLHHIKQTDFTKKRLVIKLQSKTKIDLLRRTLTADGFQEDELVTLVSSTDVKQSSAYKKFLKALPGQDSFGEKTKVILVTSFINEGLDLYADHQLEFVNVERKSTFSVDDLVQFADRHRTDQDKVLVSFHRKQAGRKPCSFNPLHEYECALEATHQHAQYLNTVRRKYAGSFAVDAIYRTAGTAYAHAERFLIEKEGELVADELGLAAFVDAEATSRTDTQTGWKAIQRRFPYFKIGTPNEAHQQAPKADLEDTKTTVRAERIEAEKALSGLFLADSGLFFQAVGSVTEDASIRKQVHFDQSRRDAALQLTSTPLFSSHIGAAEHLTAWYHKLTKEGLPVDAVQKLLVQEDGTHTSRQKLTEFLTGLRLNVLLFIYRTAGKSPVLTVQQRSDAHSMETFFSSVTSKTRVSAPEAHRLLQAAYKGAKRTDLTPRKAVKMLTYCFAVQESRTSSGTFFSVGTAHTPRTFLTESGVSIEHAEIFTEKLLNSLNVNSLRCNFMHPFI
jgi:hypothetical protein